jgi:uncharacterized protein (TIGR03382 family)
MRARTWTAVGVALAWSAVASATPTRPHRFRTNPQRANRALTLQRLLAPAHAGGTGGTGGTGSTGGGGTGGTGGSSSTCDFEFGDCFWWIGAASSATSGIPNSGVRATMSAVDYEPDGGCFDCWTSEYLDNGYWGQVGFSACGYNANSQNNFTVFYQTWNADAGLLLVDGESTWITEGLHTFAMNLDAGTSWDYSVDGIIFGSQDMGSATASSPYAISTLCEEGDGVAAAFVPPAISVPATMQVDDTGTWSATTEGLAYNTAGLSGAVGNLQDATLANDQMTIGGTSAYVAPGDDLWNGSGSGALVDAGPSTLAPVYVTLSAPLANATVAGVVPIVANIPAAPSGSTVYFFASNPNGPECTLTAPPWTCSWDTTQYGDGQVGVYAEIQDPSGNLSWADITVTVDNDGNPTTGGSSSGGSSGTSGGVGSSSGGSSSGSTGGGASGGSTSTGGSTSGGGASSGGSSGGGATSNGGAGGNAAGSTGSSTQTPASTGCGCAAGRGSPTAALPLLLLLGWIGRRRRSGGLA